MEAWFSSCYHAINGRLNVQPLTEAILSLCGSNTGSGNLVIHSSISGLCPPVDFRKWDAVRFIDELCKSGYTVLLPAFTFSFTRTRSFSTNSKSEVGILPDWVRELLPYSRRTIDPIYSFVVAGNNADAILRLSANTCWGDGSVFEYIEQTNAKYVLMGCDWNSCTQIHRYEEMKRVPYRYFKEFHGIHHEDAGKIRETSSIMYVRDLEINAMYDFNRIERHFSNAISFKQQELYR